jgi:hypothetical protein
MIKKNTLAYRRNCSKRNFGKKEKILYLAVVTWFEANFWTCIPFTWIVRNSDVLWEWSLLTPPSPLESLSSCRTSPRGRNKVFAILKSNVECNDGRPEICVKHYNYLFWVPLKILKMKRRCFTYILEWKYVKVSMNELILRN